MLYNEILAHAAESGVGIPPWPISVMWGSTNLILLLTLRRISKK